MLVKRFQLLSMSNRSLDDTGSTIYGEKFLLKEAKSLIEFARGSEIINGGFGYLNSRGQVDTDQPRQTYVQCRMIQVFGLTHVMDLQNSSRLIKHGVDALNDLFFDYRSSGFYNAIDLSGKPLGNSKLGYDHMFVLLAAVTANAAGIDGASKLLQRVFEKTVQTSAAHTLPGASCIAHDPKNLEEQHVQRPEENVHRN